ncbi:MAG: FAD-binding protein, partial [Duodenibacillus sp.]|nr:FAD-binding protein [Duodenibacillus sp.]
GGFGANPRMRALFDPRMLKLTTTNQPGATGEMITYAQDIGAQTVGMDYIQCIPGAPLGDKTRSAFFNVVKRFIFVDKQGKRFIAEDQRRDVLRDAFLALPDPVAFVVIDSDGWDDMPAGPKLRCEASIKAGEAWKCDSVEELARKMGVPAEAFVKTMADYNAGVEAGKDALGRSPGAMTRLVKPPFYAGRASMAVHHTMGGLLIDADARVIDRRGEAIAGLYAAGETTGGIHGTNRVGGNAIADIFTFGRIAGRSAAAAK